MLRINPLKIQNLDIKLNEGLWWNVERYALIQSPVTNENIRTSYREMLTRNVNVNHTLSFICDHSFFFWTEEFPAWHWGWFRWCCKRARPGPGHQHRVAAHVGQAVFPQLLSRTGLQRGRSIEKDSCNCLMHVR